MNSFFQVKKYYRSSNEKFNKWFFELVRDDEAPAPWLVDTTVQSKAAVTPSQGAPICKGVCQPKTYRIRRKLWRWMRDDVTSRRQWEECVKALKYGKSVKQNF